MVVFPNAKINIGLYVTEKRPDGFHNLETVFMPLAERYDVLEAVPAEADGIALSGLPVDGDPSKNLVWKALQLLKARFPGRLPALQIYLHKVIPMGAGLGGGSADGAFALRMLNELGNLGLSDRELESLALELGSDCPFFIRNSPQYAVGRGERMEPLPLSLAGYVIRLETPGIHVSTATAFGQISPKPAPFDLRQLPALPLHEWKDRVGNDFEGPVFAAHPQIRALKEKMYADGAVYAQMSGTGSAVFGIFPAS